MPADQRKKPGRPLTYDKKLCMWIDTPLLRDVDRIAEREGLSRAMMVRQLLEWALEDHA